MKKKMNKKGFTLIELLSVIVLMLAISVMAITSISAAIERNKAKQDKVKEEVIITYAKLYYEEHKNTETDKCIEISKLELSETEGKYSNGNKITGVVKYNGTQKKWIIQSAC